MNRPPSSAQVFIRAMSGPLKAYFREAFDACQKEGTQGREYLRARLTRAAATLAAETEKTYDAATAHKGKE